MQEHLQLDTLLQLQQQLFDRIFNSTIANWAPAPINWARSEFGDFCLHTCKLLYLAFNAKLQNIKTLNPDKLSKEKIFLLKDMIGYVPKF